jgi:hypothetical protein
MGEPKGDWDDGISNTLRFSGVESRPNLDLADSGADDFSSLVTRTLESGRVDVPGDLRVAFGLESLL